MDRLAVAIKETSSGKLNVSNLGLTETELAVLETIESLVLSSDRGLETIFHFQDDPIEWAVQLPQLIELDH